MYCYDTEITREEQGERYMNLEINKIVHDFTQKCLKVNLD